MKRILIVDDDAAVREAYREILAPRGDGFSQTGEGLFGSAPRHLSKKPLSYEIQEAENGAKAGEIVRKARHLGKPFGAAFVDMKMPGMNGAETVREIPAICPGPVQPVGF